MYSKNGDDDDDERSKYDKLDSLIGFKKLLTQTCRGQTGAEFDNGNKLGILITH